MTGYNRDYHKRHHKRDKGYIVRHPPLTTIATIQMGRRKVRDPGKTIMDIRVQVVLTIHPATLLHPLTNIKAHQAQVNSQKLKTMDILPVLPISHSSIIDYNSCFDNGNCKVPEFARLNFPY